MAHEKVALRVMVVSTGEAVHMGRSLRGLHEWTISPPAFGCTCSKLALESMKEGSRQRLCGLTAETVSLGFHNMPPQRLQSGVHAYTWGP
ncbi:hypothetical protein NHX12_028550 [Muraenolepis orangiensis]|uniref:Uncharacterized protein n=1 Tax=Muraenolepis orangiensis TaxID=630683 RepID=A0A9Q0EC08_9TELE|nr:hypothetical protein NHX12_028550 [Muraenolepis orangiensis]